MRERQQHDRRARGRYFQADRTRPDQAPDRAGSDQRAPGARREATVPERGAGVRKAAPKRASRRSQGHPHDPDHRHAGGARAGRSIQRPTHQDTPSAPPDR
jgi:hypothetical protein